jgi:hypothetical protein
VHKARQFAALLLISVGIVLAGCEAHSTPEAVQTVLPSLQFLLAGASVQVHTSPEGAPREGVIDVAIDGTDTSGALARLDSRARQAAAGAALLSAAQYYPNATISLNVVDGSGAPVVKASRAPGHVPEFQ